jgi:hypothetical protein
MIKFFRKIRQRLVTKNLPTGTGRAGKFSKYLIYAIGEIILVVLGILIALQINNWNEDRKIFEDLDLIRQSLFSELNKDIESINNELDLLNKDIAKLENYFQRISSPLVNKDSLVNIYNIEFNPIIYGAIKFNNSTINTLKASGYLSKLEKSMQEDLFKILEMKENYFTVHSDIANYVDVLTLNGNKFPRSIEPLEKNSVLNKSIWKKVDFEELGGYMNNVFGVKYITSKSARESLQRINTASLNLTQKL